MKSWLYQRSAKLLYLFLALFALCGLASAEETRAPEAVWVDDGRQLLSVGEGRTLNLHDGETGEVLQRVVAPGEPSTYFSFSPDSGWEVPNPIFGLKASGSTAVAGSADDSVFWWSLPNLTLVHTEQSSYSQAGLAVGGDTVVVISTSTRYLDSSFQVFRRQGSDWTSLSLSELPAPDSSQSYGSLSVSPNGRFVSAWTGSYHQLWDLDTPEVTSTTLQEVNNLWLGDRSIYNLDGGVISVRSYEKPETVLRQVSCGTVKDYWVTADEKRLITLDSQGVGWWDLETGSALGRLDLAQEADRMVVSAQGEKVLLWTQDQVRGYHLPSGRELFTLQN